MKALYPSMQGESWETTGMAGLQQQGSHCHTRAPRAEECPERGQHRGSVSFPPNPPCQSPHFQGKPVDKGREPPESRQSCLGRDRECGWRGHGREEARYLFLLIPVAEKLSLSQEGCLNKLLWPKPANGRLSLLQVARCLRIESERRGVCLAVLCHLIGISLGR